MMFSKKKKNKLIHQGTGTVGSRGGRWTDLWKTKRFCVWCLSSWGGQSGGSKERESASGVPETGHCDKDEHVPGDQIVCLKVISKPGAGGSYRWPEARQKTGVSGVFSSHCAGQTDSVLFTAWNSSLLWRRFAHMKVCSFCWRYIWQLTSGMEFSLVTC